MAEFYIILPMYNEEKAVGPLEAMFCKVNLPPGTSYRILVVNDGSTDRTLQEVHMWQSRNPLVKVVSHPHNMGLGRALLTGFREAVKENPSGVITMDADATHPPETVSALVQKLLNGADIVIASRYAPGGAQHGVPWPRKLYSFGARMLLRLVFPLKGVRDYTVGFRAYRTGIIREALSRKSDSLVSFRSFASTVEILLKLATLARQIDEVPLILRYDQKKSRSKMKVLSTIRDYVRLCFMPKQKCTLGRGLKF